MFLWKLKINWKLEDSHINIILIKGMDEYDGFFINYLYLFIFNWTSHIRGITFLVCRSNKRLNFQ